MYSDYIEYVRELYNKPTGALGLHEPKFLGNEKNYVLDAIDSTFVSSVGEYVNRVEIMLQSITGANFAVALVNGTNALHLALELVGVKSNDEVLTQSLTFVATANAISYINAIPHFVDVDNDTMGLSPDKLEIYLNEIAEVKENACFNKITGRKISACVPMHTFGLPMRIDKLVSVCEKFNIPVVEDAAESIGSYYNNKHTGTFGKVGVFSFNGNKTVTCGGGGALITNDGELAKKAKHLSTQAKMPHQWDFTHDEIGYNYRMPNLNAAMLCAQLEQLDFYIINKRETAKEYHRFFTKLGYALSKIEIENSKSNYWLNAIQFKNKDERNLFLTQTNEAGIMTRPVWTLMNELPHFAYHPKSDLSTSKFLQERIVNIPSSIRV